MLHSLMSPRMLILVTFLASVTFIQFRDRVRHKFSRLVADHANLLAPYNALMYLFSAIKAKPYADIREFPELHTFFKRGWKRFYLKWYGDFLPSASALCPKTAELLGKIPSINAAMFTLLPPGSRLGAHRDPFAGSLRYHLGLITPNSPDCYLVVDGQKYHWKDGEAVMFDETYIHQAENRTGVARVILFCDIERPISNPVLRWINRTIGHGMIRAAATQNVPGEHVGVLNHIFAYVYQIRALGIRIKEWHAPLYYLLKWCLIAALGFGLVVGF